MKNGESDIPTVSGGQGAATSVQRASRCPVCLCADACLMKAVNVR